MTASLASPQVQDFEAMPPSEISLPSLGAGSSQQSEAWGTPSFKGCRFCRRDRSAANPIIACRASRPTLQFKSDRHQECLPCCGKLRRGNANLITAEQRAAFAKKLAEDDVAYSNHMEELGEYEAGLNARAEKAATSGKKRRFAEATRVFGWRS